MPSLLREMQSMHPDNIIDFTTIEEDDNVPSNLPVGSVPAEVHDSPTYADIAGRTDRQQSPDSRAFVSPASSAPPLAHAAATQFLPTQEVSCTPSLPSQTRTHAPSSLVALHRPLSGPTAVHITSPEFFGPDGTLADPVQPQAAVPQPQLPRDNGDLHDARRVDPSPDPSALQHRAAERY